MYGLRAVPYLIKDYTREENPKFDGDIIQKKEINSFILDNLHPRLSDCC